MAAGLTAYFDTSALLKLYLEERESESVRLLSRRAPITCTHLITYAEVRAGLAQAERLGRIDESALAGHVERFEVDWATMNVVVPTETHIRRAGDLAQHFGLRGYDSVQLAAAEAVRQVLPNMDFCFVAFDKRLAKAAAALGMRGVA